MTQKRGVLEVLKWLEPESVLRDCTLVDRLWYLACTAEELWIIFCEDCDFISFPDYPDLAASQVFKLAQTERLHQLPVLDFDRLDIFNCCTRVYTAHISFQSPLTEIFDLAAVLLPTGKLLFHCGGGNNSAGLIDLQGNQISLCSMTKSRKFHSAVYFKMTIYVVGGAGKSAEKLSIYPQDTLTSRSWETLPDMQFPRAACQPCRYRRQFYLFGGNTNACEVFDTDFESFLPLPLLLPESQYGCVGFRINDEFVVVTGNCLTRWKPGDAPIVTAHRGTLPAVWTCMQQCYFNETIYSVDAGRIRILNLRTQTQTYMQYTDILS